MSTSTHLDFEVRWLPYQLNPAASEVPSSKTEMYMRKFGKSKDQVKQMALGMGQRFAEVGLPFRTEGDSLTGNTMQAHRVLTAAFQVGGPVAQDKAVEVIFNGYFGDGKAPNDALVLREAMAAAGVDETAAQSDATTAAVQQELSEGRKIVDSGVPHFVFRNQAGRSVQFSGAQPPQQFLQAFASISD